MGGIYSRFRDSQNELPQNSEGVEATAPKERVYRQNAVLIGRRSIDAWPTIIGRTWVEKMLAVGRCEISCHIGRPSTSPGQDAIPV